MSVRTGVAILSLAAVVTAAVACSAASRPTELGPLPSQTTASPEPTTPTTTPKTTPAPGVSWLQVMPQEGLRGATVSLDVACLDTLGPVRSPVLDIIELQADPAGHQPWHRTGTATVHMDAAPGPYPISATCGTEQLSATFTVVPHP